MTVGRPVNVGVAFERAGKAGTDASGINDVGQIVQEFFDLTGNHYGFLATPVAAAPEPSSPALLGVGLIVLGMLRRRKRTYPNGWR
jgi:hypothetical protein